MADFNPVRTERTIVQTKGNRYQKKFFPAAGNTAAVVYVDATPANKAAIAGLIDQIHALAEQCVFKTWVAEPLDGEHDPAVDVRMLVIADDRAPAE